jgi:TRAP-type C4-dicarboxylate transport system substrate-binding protein
MITTPNTPVRKVEDMKGLKIRIPPSRISNEVFPAWGAIPTPMPFTEIFMALRQNVVNGEDIG